MKSAKNIKNGFYAKTFSYSVIFYQILMLFMFFNISYVPL